VLFRSVAYDPDDAVDRVCNGFSTDSSYEEDIDDYGDMFFISTDLIEKETK
jgi:hypothetical protein